MFHREQSVSRRTFLERLGLLVGATYTACLTEPGSSGGQLAAKLSDSTSLQFQHPVGVQLYTVRNQMQSDADAALKGIAEIGFTQVEVLSQMLPHIGPLLQKYRLEPVSGHFPLPLITGNFEFWPPGVGGGLENWEQAVELAQQHGLRQMVIAYVQQGERTSIDFYRSLADQMNRAGEQCRDAGIQLAYHHHAFEFEPLQGEVPFEILADRFADSVHWQLDVFWLAMAGKEPHETLQRFSGKVPSVHLKDIAVGVSPHLQERLVGPDSFAEVGSGQLDFESILKAADAAGVRYYFVEQDHTAGDPLDSLRSSFQFLKG